MVTLAPLIAKPLPALPQNAAPIELLFEPAYDYARDSCYSVPALDATGTQIAAGLPLAGDVTEGCRDSSRIGLGKTNVYSRHRCNNGWCAVMYSSYFEKDQARRIFGTGQESLPFGLGGPGGLLDGWGPNKDIVGWDWGAGIAAGHRHDWEHVVVWVKISESESSNAGVVSKDGELKQRGAAASKSASVHFVSTSAHGKFVVHPHEAILFTARPVSSSSSSTGEAVGDMGSNYRGASSLSSPSANVNGPPATHAKVLFRKDGLSTHNFVPARSLDEPPKNHRGAWQFPAVVGWDAPGFADSEGRALLAAHDFGRADFGIKDGEFDENLAKSLPAQLRGVFEPRLHDDRVLEGWDGAVNGHASNWSELQEKANTAHNVKEEL